MDYFAFEICKWVIWFITLSLLATFISVLSNPDYYNNDSKIAITSLYIIFTVGSLLCFSISAFGEPNPEINSKFDKTFVHVIYILGTIVFAISLIVFLINGGISQILTLSSSPPSTSPAPAQQIARSFQLPKTFQLPATKPPMFQLPDLNGVYSELTRLKDQFNIAKE